MIVGNPPSLFYADWQDLSVSVQILILYQKCVVKLKERVNICQLIYCSLFGFTFAIERNGSTFCEIAEKRFSVLYLSVDIHFYFITFCKEN